MRKQIISPILASLLTLILATTLQAQSFFSAVTNLHPVGYWPLNENTAPPPSAPAAANSGTLGAADNGAYTDGAIPGVPGALAGVADGGCLFSGATAVNPRMAAPFDPAYASVTHFTIEAWVNSAITDPGTETVVGCLDPASPRAGWLLYAGGSGNGAFDFRAYNQNGTSTSLDQLLSVPGGHTLSNTWYHVVVTFDGTHAVGYINGAPVTNATVTGTGYVPSTAGPLTIGARSDSALPFPGYIDEVAFYSNLLSASDILAHYRAGTNPAPTTSYFTLVTNNHPLLYYRLGDGGTAPVARDFGSLGAFGNGYYEAGTSPGAAGPDFPGMGASNFACTFGGSQSADIGPSVPVVGLAGLPLGISNSPSTLAAWVQVPSGGVGYFETVAGKGDQVYRFDADSPAGLPHWNAGTDADLVGNQALDDGAWHYWVGVWDGTNQYIYIDGALAGQDTPNPGTGGNTQPFLIGTAPDNTGRNFNGTVCQVALFDKALTAAQVQTVYFSAGGPPVIAAQPQTTVTITGSNVSLTISAIGKAPLTYQWFKGSPGSGTPASGPDISGANTATLRFTSVKAADAASYYAVVTDNAGLTNNSAIAALTVITTPLAGSFFPAVVNLNPLGYWPLNETVQPAPSPVAINQGTLGSSGTAAYSASGITYAQPGALTDGDTSIATDGTAGVVTLPFSPVLSLNAPFSAEAWLNTADTTTTLCPLACADPNSPRSGWLIYMAGQNPGSYNFRMYNQNGTSASLSISSPANVINAGEWHHVVVVYDGTTGYIYVDGQLGSSGAPTGTPTFAPNDAGALTIGARSDASFFFHGGEDEVAIYTNALSAATILAHYQAGTNASPSPTYKQLVLQAKPILYYRLDEPTPSAPPPITSDPVASNYGGLGTSDNGYYLPGCFPGTVPGPQFPGLPSSVACQFIPAYGGLVEVPQDANNALDLHSPMTITAWIQANLHDTRFQSFLGRGDNSYRMDVDGSGSIHWALPVGEPVGSNVQDAKWHFIAGIWDGETMSIYIDGVLDAAQDGDSGGWAAVSQPFDIGGVPDYIPGRIFNGNMAQVAIFGRALTAGQIQTLYNAADVPPYIINQPATVTYVINTTATLSVEASGTPNLSYQWYEGTTKLSNSGNVSGVTTPELTIAPAQLADSGSYSVVITNNYGAITSSVAVLSIVSGPIILPDLPATTYVYNGTTAVLSVGLGGTGPFQNQWFYNGHPLADGGRISGTQTPTLMIANAQPGDAGNYQFWSTNSIGVSHSSVGAVVVESVLGISSTNNPIASGWTPNGSAIYTPSAVNGVLTMTTAKNSEATSFFFNYPVYIGNFIAKFTYQDVSIGGADGLTFCLQNDPRGLTAVGGGGSGVGYSGITPSAAFALEVYTGFNPVGWQFATGGTAPTSYNDTSPVSLGSGDPINWTIVYDGNNVALTMFDVKSNLTYTTTFVAGSLPTTVGGDTALVGFTGATGGVNALQTISNFSYIPLAPVLSIARDGSGGVFITWPAVSSYALEKNPSLVNPAGWTSVPGPYPTVSGPLYDEYRVHVTPATGAAYYRLVVSP